MALAIHRDEDPDRPEAVVTCDAELADDCHALTELGRRPHFTDAQFHDLVLTELGWAFDDRHHRYLCPPCRDLDQQRRRPATLAREGFAAPYGTPPTRPGRRGTAPG